MIYFPELDKYRDLLQARGLSEVLSKKLVFSITTGRTGTQSLASVLGCAANTHSEHEPDPPYSNCLHRVQRNAEAALEFLLNEKLPIIAQSTAACYVEMSHLFCKGFVEPILELGLRPHFLFIDRDPRAIATSFLQLNSVPERTPLGRDYMLSPADPCLLPAPSWQDFTDYELCYWYVLELRRRAQWYKALFDRIGITYSDFDFADLRDVQRVVAVIGECGLETTPATLPQVQDILSKPANTKADDKINAGRSAEVSDRVRLQHAEAFVLRACRASAADDFLPRFRLRAA